MDVIMIIYRLGCVEIHIQKKADVSRVRHAKRDGKTQNLRHVCYLQGRTGRSVRLAPRRPRKRFLRVIRKPTILNDGLLKCVKHRGDVFV